MDKASNKFYELLNEEKSKLEQVYEKKAKELDDAYKQVNTIQAEIEQLKGAYSNINRLEERMNETGSEEGEE